MGSFEKNHKKTGNKRCKESLRRNEITPVNKAIDILKIVILTMFFELEISYVVSEINKRHKIRKFLGIENEVKLKSVYDFMGFEAEQFANFVFYLLMLIRKERERMPLR